MVARVLSSIRILTCTIAVVLLLVGAFPTTDKRVYSQASALSNRSLDLSSSQPGLINAVHEYLFTFTNSNLVGSMAFQYCSNDPFPDTACSSPSGIDTSSASLTNQGGETGFSVHANTNSNRIVLARPAATLILPQASEYEFSSITNPDTPGSYYVRITTYSSTDGTGPTLDSAGLAFSINDRFAISTEVPPYLLFCSSVSIPGGSCANAVGQQISFGNFSTNNTSTATSQFLVATNATSGVNVTVTGTTLTSGNFQIPNLNNPFASLTGVSQFGINLRNNSLPNVGAEPTGSGSVVPTPLYNGQEQFAFRPNSTVARSTGTSAPKKFTVSYIVNVGNNQQAGQYSTTLGYIALASF